MPYPSKKHPFVICDLDGTIADLTHRLHFIKNADGTKKKYKDADWDSFHKACVDDTPISHVIEQVKAEAIGRSVYFFSGRNEVVRRETEQWLNWHFNGHFPNGYSLSMRAEGDRRPDTIVKLEMIRRHLFKPEDVLTIHDDRQCVVDMWRANGFHCSQEAAWKEDAPAELSSADRIPKWAKEHRRESRTTTELPDFWAKESYNEDLL